MRGPIYFIVLLPNFTVSYTGCILFRVNKISPKIMSHISQVFDFAIFRKGIIGGIKFCVFSIL